MRASQRSKKTAYWQSAQVLSVPNGVDTSALPWEANTSAGGSVPNSQSRRILERGA